MITDDSHGHKDIETGIGIEFVRDGLKRSDFFSIFRKSAVNGLIREKFELSRSIFLRESFLCEKAKIVQHISSKEKRCRTNEEAIWES